MKNVPMWISNRHIHLSQKDADVLFWIWYELTKMKDLSQPGQFACEETLTIVWPKWQYEWVRILWPYRKDTQVEIMIADGFKLGVQAPIRLSGDLNGTPGIEVKGPKGSVVIAQWVIVAKRHIHINPQEAEMYGVLDGEIVSVKTQGERWLSFDQVVVRVTPQSALDMHIDIEEANAAWVQNGDMGELL